MDLFIYRRTTVSDALLGSGEKAMEDTNVASMELAFQWHGKMSQKRSILKKKKMLPKVKPYLWLCEETEFLASV